MFRNKNSHENLKISGSVLVWSMILIVAAATAVADVGG
jgi:hypothetical protein